MVVYFTENKLYTNRFMVVYNIFKLYTFRHRNVYNSSVNKKDVSASETHLALYLIDVKPFGLSIY